MTWTPTPRVLLGSGGGVEVATGGPDDQVVLDGLSVTWGTDEPIGQADLATGTVTIFDRTRTWALDTPLIGQPVTLQWVTTTPEALQIAFFYGRVTEVHVTSLTAGGVSGSRVVLRLVSILQDLANRISTFGWPAESYTARAARVRTVSAGPVTTLEEPLGIGGGMVPVPSKDQVSALDHIHRLFDTAGGNRWYYQPNARLIREVPRRHDTTRRTLLGLVSTPTGARILPVTRPSIGTDVYRVTLDGRTTGYDPGTEGIRRRVTQNISHVHYIYPQFSASYDDVTAERAVPGVSAAVTGERVAQLDSDQTDPDAADLAAWQYVSRVAHEGRAWQLEPLVWRTRDHGGAFPDEHTCRALLAGHESDAWMFLAGSYLTGIGVRPVVGVQGGVISYRNGGWELELNPAPVSTTLPQHSITPAEIDDGTLGNQVQWWDDGEHPDGLHKSVSCDDLRWVGTGVGVTVPGPDTGWDETHS